MKLCQMLQRLLSKLSLMFPAGILTPRQQYLMSHGRKRVRKKWQNVLIKRMERLYKA